MKAWIVTLKDSDEYEFVLAETRGQAKYRSHAISWGDWTELRARRIPELDGIEHPTDWDWYDRTSRYAYTCTSCGEYLDTSGDDLFVFSEDGWIYHESCQQEAEEDWKQTCEGFNRAMQIDDGSILAIREILSDL